MTPAAYRLGDLPRWVVAAVVAGLFALIFVLRLVLNDPTTGAGVLYSIPVAAAALVAGLRAGLLGAAAAVAFSIVDDTVGGSYLPPVGYLARGVGFVLVGGLTGWYVDRLDAARRAQGFIVESSPDAIVGVDGQGVIVSVNQRAASLFGYPPDELVGRPVEVLVPEEARARHTDQLAAYVAHPRIRPMDSATLLEGRRKDGTTFPVEVSLHPQPDRDRFLVLATIRDVSARLSTQTQLVESAERFGAAFDQAPVGMALVKFDGRLLRVNDTLAAMTGRTPDDLVGRSLASITYPEDRELDFEGIADLIAGRTATLRMERRLVDVAGEPVWGQWTLGLVRDGRRRPRYLLLHVEDISDRKRYEGQLLYLADHDPLTGLLNRRRFEHDLMAHLAHIERYGGAGALLLLDLDNFKYVNDTLGHPTGDALIRVVADVLRERVRSSDTLARLGGDEFALLLPTAAPDEAQQVARAIIRAVGRDGVVTQGSERVRTTVSIGVAPLTAGVSTTPEEVLAQADLAMYAAKDAGRDRYAVYHPASALVARSAARFRSLERIHSALEQDLFVLYAQPILDLASGVVSHHELLLRMRAGDDLLEPGEFLPVAELHGLARPIDRWVIHHAIELAVADSAGRLGVLEVNVSADSVSDPDLPALIESELTESGVDPRRMVFEITETAAVANLDQARALILQLSNLGCGFALDDFGAGFGSFYYLKHLPFDYLKIDGEFVRRLPSSRTDQVIVQSIVATAHGLGKRTVAEFVTDEESVALLREQGVDFAQGYHIGRPQPLARLLSR